MPRLRSKEGEAPSDDYGWRWGEPVEGGRNNVKYKFCERVINGGITRLKEHLVEERIRGGKNKIRRSWRLW
ncbi:hypothetical protein Gotur_031984 [Gossypium turneri]